MQKKNYECFEVYSIDDRHSFINFNILDEHKLYKELFEFFFSEEKLLSYIENKKNVKFIPGKRAYTLLFRHLKNYIDDTNQEIEYVTLETEIEKILISEGLVTVDKGKMIARKDKIGKIGEYIFACLLGSFFNFTCVIPKVHLVTDYNMSVYGIDEIFYSDIDNMLLFGESKVSINLKNGITLIKKSLSEYEKQIQDEYELVLCNRLYGQKLNVFHDKYGDQTEVCVSFNEFVQETGITDIGIPIFIAHGTETDPSKILKKLKSIPKDNILGLNTHYYFISLPVVDKFKMIAYFTEQIRAKLSEYEEKRNEKTTG